MISNSVDISCTPNKATINISVQIESTDWLNIHRYGRKKSWLSVVKALEFILSYTQIESFRQSHK